MTGIHRRVLLAFAFAFAMPIAQASAQQAPMANAETVIPGQWSATSPQGTTTIHFALNEKPTKNPDGSLSFTGKMWSTGAVSGNEAPLSTAKLDPNNKLALAYPAGTGSLTWDGSAFVGFITYGQAVLQNMNFKKK